MPSRFPFLKSKTDPYGLIEQFGIAVTVDPESDPSETASGSWFGVTLDDSPNAFVFTYSDDNTTNQPDRITGHGTITNAYAQGKLLYTAYDWVLTSLKIDVATKTGEVEGAVRLKGHCDLCVNNPTTHNGRHWFHYVIVKVGRDWLIKEWTLRKEKKPMAPPDPLGEFVESLF
ncbi:MAG TPA: hypothetical protein VIQ24_04840 [Pyrinomonadaceae bacterium]